jgi:hypothetical protein
MELVIVASLGALGYRLAARGKSLRENQKAEVPPVLYRGSPTGGGAPAQMHESVPRPQLAGTLALEQDLDCVRKHTTTAHQRRAIGALTSPGDIRRTIYEQRAAAPAPPDPVPHFSSRTRHAMPDTQRRLELFTGQDDIAFRPKEERQAIFDPGETRVPVGSAGAAQTVSALAQDAQRSKIISADIFKVRNNVGPTERILVGPGIGIPADAPVSGDGLHSMYRHYPVESLQEHRINQLGTMHNHGALPSSAHKPPTASEFAKHRPSLVDEKPHVTGVRAAAASAPRVRAEVVVKKVKKIDGDTYIPPPGVAATPTGRPSVAPCKDWTPKFGKQLGAVPPKSGWLGASGPQARTPEAAAEFLRRDAGPTKPLLGPNGLTRAGGYVPAGEWVRQRRRPDGNEGSTNPGGAGYAGAGAYLIQPQDIRRTDREMGNAEPTGPANATGVAFAPPAPECTVMRHTGRSTEARVSGGFAGPLGGTCAPSAPNPTMRDVTPNVWMPTYGSRPGAAATVSADVALGRDDRPHDARVEMGALSGGAGYASGQVQTRHGGKVRPDACGARTAPGIRPVGRAWTEAKTKFGRKVPSENPRDPESIIRC